MNRHQKLGVFSFRLIGVLHIFFGLVAAILLTFWWSDRYKGDLYIITAPVIFWAVFSIPGIVMIWLSRKLGRFVGKNLDD